MPAPDPSTPPSHVSPADRSRLPRRTALAAIGTALTSALAGCNALNDDTAPLHDGDWQSYGNGPTNANRVAGGAPQPTVHDSLHPASWAYAPPVVHDGVAYFATDQRVVALTADGTEQWSRALDGEVFGVPALDPDRGRLYVPASPDASTDPEPASVATLSLDDGVAINTHRVGDERTYGVTVYEGDIYARSSTTCLRLAPDGTERWRRPLDPLSYDEYNLGDDTATQIPPAVTADAVYVPDNDALVRLDRETGDEDWRVPVDTPYAASVVDDDVVVQTGWQEVVATTTDGSVRWRRDLHSRAAAAVDGGDVYIIDTDLHELDSETGETNWQVHLPSEGTGAPVVTDDTVVVATGNVRAFRRETGGLLGPDRVRWETDRGHAADYASPVVAGGRIFVVGNAGLQAFSTGE